jgi:hypothetical protein
MVVLQNIVPRTLPLDNSTDEEKVDSNLIFILDLKKKEKS